MYGYLRPVVAARVASSLLHIINIYEMFNGALYAKKNDVWVAKQNCKVLWYVFIALGLKKEIGFVDWNT